MRRKDREVTDTAEISEILNKSKICHLAMVDNGKPYIIPLSYGYELIDDILTLYFHSAKEGRKLDILRKNNAVCFEIYHEDGVHLDREMPCKSACYFSSVHGFGDVHFIDDTAERCHGLKVLMQNQYDVDFEFTPVQADKVCVYKVISREFTGKSNNKPTE